MTDRLLAPQPTMKRLADANGADFYPTPKWATHALILNEPFYGSVWEPCCGNGAMSEVIKTWHPVMSSDLFDRGYGETGHDFLTSNRRADNIITNPPYAQAEAFVTKALQCANKKVAMLLRLAFLEGSGRAGGLFKHTPPSRVLVFSERITFYPNGERTGGGGTMAYAWFIWDKAHAGPPVIYWTEPGLKKLYGE